LPPGSTLQQTDSAVQQATQLLLANPAVDSVLETDLGLESTTPNSAKKGLNYWCQDETRLGLKTIERKKNTALGVKPIGKVQWNFKAYYLYGAVAPQTGESLIVRILT
jgi:hypothetical protein